jgi:hypothetical protein
MSYTKIWFAGVLIVLSAAPAWSSAEDKPKQAKSRIRVEVRFSVKEFDPKNPKEGFLECVVHNGSDKPIKVPSGYASGFDSNIVLFGRVGKDKKTIGNVSFWWDLRLVWRGKQREATKTSFTVVDPGKEQVVFKDGLNELLIERKESGWTWEA